MKVYKYLDVQYIRLFCLIYNTLYIPVYNIPFFFLSFFIESLPVSNSGRGKGTSNVSSKGDLSGPPSRLRNSKSSIGYPPRYLANRLRSESHTHLIKSLSLVLIFRNIKRIMYSKCILKVSCVIIIYVSL